MTGPDSNIPREFEIPIYNQGRLFGVFLAAHAIPDAVNLMHTGVGCKPKAQRQITMHDRGREAQNKMVWSDVTERHLIQGSAEALRNIVHETVKRREGVGLILLTASTAMELTGIDLSALARELDAELPCAVVYVPTPGTHGDHYDGYTDALSAVLQQCPWDGPITRPNQVSLVGYPFDRYERDHPANLHEMGRLLVAIGAEPGPTFLSGAPLVALRRAPEGAALAVLPWAQRLPRAQLDALGRPHLRVTAPLSSRGARAFLEQIADLLDLPKRRVSVVVDREEQKVAPLLRIAREQLEGHRVAVLAETPRAAGLTAAAMELGLRPNLVGLLDRSLGGADAFQAALTELGQTLPDSCQLLPAPTVTDVAAAAADPPELWMAPDIWLPPELARSAAWVEVGIPSNRKRGLYAMPDVGWNGLVALAQRLLDALRGVH